MRRVSISASVRLISVSSKYGNDDCCYPINLPMIYAGAVDRRVNSKALKRPQGRLEPLASGLSSQIKYRSNI